MFLLASDYSAGYAAGEYAAIALLAAGAIGLGLRAYDRPGRRAAAAATPLPPAAPAHATTGSVAPPGCPEPTGALTPAPVAARPRSTGRSRRHRITDAIAALVCGVLLVAALVRFADHHIGNGPWDTPQGREMHAGFLAGCRGNSGASAQYDCECVFQHLTAAPPYDTPASVLAAQSSFARAVLTAVRTRDPNALPPGMLDAMRACVES